MLVVTLVLISLPAGLLVTALALRWPAIDPASPRVARPSARRVGRAMAEHRRLRRFVADRTNPAVATGLLLTVALAVTIVSATALGVLIVLVQGDSALVGLDRDISRWAHEHSSPFAHDVIQAITQLGATEYVVAFTIILFVVELRRRPSRWLIPFVAVVLIGQSVLTNTIKPLLDRVRPALDPAAHLLGPSFPSGHTATAAAFWSATALVLGRGRGRRAHAMLAGGAVTLGVAVACSRVLLDVHWFSDVIGGLALGWAWFALCSIAFGGRLLVFGAPVQAGERMLVAAEASVPQGTAETSGSSIGIEQPSVQEVQDRTSER